MALNQYSEMAVGSDMAVAHMQPGSEMDGGTPYSN